MPAQGISQKLGNTPKIYVTGNYQDNSFHGPYMATGVNMANPGLGSPENQLLCRSKDSGFTGSFASNSKLTLDESGSGSITTTTSGFMCEQLPNVQCEQQISSNFSSPNSVSSYQSGTIYRNYPVSSHIGTFEQGQHSHYSAYFPPTHIATVGGAHMNTPPFTSLPPPPEYPGFHAQAHLDQPTTRRSYEILAKPEIAGSRSQPDMVHYTEKRSGSKHLGVMHAHGGSGSDKGSQHSLDKK